jgi:hypothetical protein
MMNVDWDNANELNAYPAFGERNPHALTSHGESLYLACKTYPMEFFDSRVPVQSRNETPPTAKEETAAWQSRSPRKSPKSATEDPDNLLCFHIEFYPEGPAWHTAMGIAVAGVGLFICCNF